MSKRKKLLRPAKHGNPLVEIRRLIKLKQVIETGHALLRLNQREITRFEYLWVLENGSREARKDSYDEN